MEKIRTDPTTCIWNSFVDETAFIKKYQEFCEMTGETFTDEGLSEYANDQNNFVLQKLRQNHSKTLCGRLLVLMETDRRWSKGQLSYHIIEDQNLKHIFDAKGYGYKIYSDEKDIRAVEFNPDGGKQYILFRELKEDKNLTSLFRAIGRTKIDVNLDYFTNSIKTYVDCLGEDVQSNISER